MHGQIVFKSISVILGFSSLKDKYIKIIINLCKWVHNIKGCNLQYEWEKGEGRSYKRVKFCKQVNFSYYQFKIIL